MKSSLTQNTWSRSRLSWISAARTFNTLLDFSFYDIAALSAREREQLSNHTSPLGGILVVHPRQANKPPQLQTSLEFVRKQKAATDEAVSTLVVAGVGSSALGTACLARDVADYLNKPVAGIVSGFGMADMWTEALAGWFVFGAANACRDALAHVLDTTGLKDHVRHQQSHKAIKRHLKQQGVDLERYIYGDPASTTLLYLLLQLGGRITLLVGHSKGNYGIENALEGLHQASERPRRTTPVTPPQIITLGAVIWFGPDFPCLQQFIGQIDFFGMLNSRPDLSFVMVPGAWHSLNRMLPGYLSVAQALKVAGVPSGGMTALGKRQPARRRPLPGGANGPESWAGVGTAASHLLGSRWTGNGEEEHPYRQRLPKTKRLPPQTTAPPGWPSEPCPRNPDVF